MLVLLTELILDELKIVPESLKMTYLSIPRPVGLPASRLTVVLLLWFAVNVPLELPPWLIVSVPLLGVAGDDHCGAALEPWLVRT